MLIYNIKIFWSLTIKKGDKTHMVSEKKDKNEDSKKNLKNSEANIFFQEIKKLGKAISKSKFSEIEEKFTSLKAKGNSTTITIGKIRNLINSFSIISSKEIIGECEEIIKLKKMVDKIAKTAVTVKIKGETGTGKELFAILIHKKSDRRDKPFIAINCGAIQKDLLETELFGYEKGAFTGADKQKVGKFEFADGGTIFLDEIESMSPAMQVALLRVLQDGIFCRVGGNSIVMTDVRIIVATKQNLGELVEKGKFREDLFYRLNVISLEIPPLRDRGDDIIILMKYFLKKYCEKYNKNSIIFMESLTKLKEYAWLGNVRELESYIERIVILSNSNILSAEDLDFLENKKNIKTNQDTSWLSEELLKTKEAFDKYLTLKEGLDKFKKNFVIAHLKKTNGVRTIAAANLDIQRTYLSRMITEYKIEIPSISRRIYKKIK